MTHSRVPRPVRYSLMTRSRRLRTFGGDLPAPVSAVLEIGFEVQALVPRRQIQPQQQAAEQGEQGEQALLELGQGIVALLAQEQHLLEAVPGVGGEGVGGDWTTARGGRKVVCHGSRLRTVPW